MKTVLVTGGAGFIGSHLVDRLLQDGYRVLVIDNMSTGRWENLRSSLNKYDETILQVEEIDPTSGYLYDESFLSNFISESDYIFHLAASVGVVNVLNDPIKCILNNNRLTEIVLKSCAEYNKRVLITSTSEVYGNSSYEFQREDDNLVYSSPSNLRWSYAVSKLTDELLALSYYRDRDLDVTIVRLFNTIGPRQLPDYGMVVPRFINQALRGEDLTVYGDGIQIRTFCSVYDVVDGLIGLIESEEAIGEIVNIGGTNSITIKHLAEIIIRITGSKSKIKYVPYIDAYDFRIEDMRSRKPWLEKANRLIGYKPKYRLEHIIEDIIECMK